MMHMIGCVAPSSDGMLTIMGIGTDSARPLVQRAADD
jgi:hypothetical protein